MITGTTRLAELFEKHPETVGVLARLHPHLGDMSAPKRRALVAPRLTVAEVARLAGLDESTVVDTLRRAIGEVAPDATDRPASQTGAPGLDPSLPVPPTRPDVLDRLHAVHVDVRDDIRRGAEPLGAIVVAARKLADDEVLVLRAPFEPIPLYQVLVLRGLAHWTERRAVDDWSVWFYRDPSPTSVAPSGPARREDVVSVDVRGLEAPQPMVKVLEQLDRLRPGQTLVVLHERRPMFLYPQIDERGFVHETDEPETGLVRITIRRPL